jgi:hypothetical protein
MGAIPLADARSGMVLEHDVVVRLLAAGVALTPAHLSLLRQWGVAEVAVRGVGRPGAGAPGAGAAPPAADPLEAEVADLFRNAGPAHPALDELKTLVLARRRREGGEGSDGQSR